LRTLKLLQRRLKKKTKGSNNWLKLQGKIARFHGKVANTRRDWLFKLAHYICGQADNIFVEDINFKSWSKGMFCKQSLDSGIGGFINQILPFICWKRGKLYFKIDKNFSSQECSNCGAFTGKKQLNERIHNCHVCHHSESRDTNSAKILMQRGNAVLGVSPMSDSCKKRGQVAVGHTILKNACGDGLSEAIQLTLFGLDKSLKQESPV
jgi:putative transposase